VEVPVLVAGGGPVGLTVAYDLQQRGVRCLVVEQNPTTTRHPKMDVTNGRTMECFRRLGISELIRDAAVPRENCMDVSWITRMNGWELARFKYPNVHEAREKIHQRNDGSQPLEPYMRMSQIVLEPLLANLLEASPLVEMRFGWAFQDMQEEDDRVVATIREVATGKTEKVICELLAGCDGGGSKVRDSLGIKQGGYFDVVPVYMVHFRSTEHDMLQRFGIAWHYQSSSGGTLIAQDDDQYWTLHQVFETDDQVGQVDPVKLVHDFVGEPIELEVLQANPWKPHLCVADHYGRGRVWLAGDSAHQFIPTGGYGMNTGIPDGLNLSWKFAAFLEGWGGQNLLKSIEVERRPIAVRNRQAAMTNMQVRLDIIEANSDVVHQENEAGDALRLRMSGLIEKLGNIENEALGIEIDDRYVASSVVCQEIVEPPWVMDAYTPSTCPGMRAPHVFLENGEAIFDLFSSGFTLVRFSEVDVAPLLDAANEKKVPISLLDIREDNARAVYEYDLVLVRPDQHVAWRGDQIDRDPGEIIDRIRGADK